MEYRKLGHTDIDVSAICLGTMTWGEQNSESEGHAQMDYAVERGINFFDTAELYPIPPKADTQGRTEGIIGTWFNDRGNRDKIILASKVIGRSSMNWFRDGNKEGRINRDQVREAIHKSLQRLQTDYIDLYQIHWPDRGVQMFGGGGLRYNPEAAQDGFPIDETLAIFQELVDEGKIRSFGLSNETPWGVLNFTYLADQGKGPRPVSVQNAYSLLNRIFELTLAETAIRDKVGLLAYSPLGQGFLTGKYQNGARPAGARGTLFPGRLGRYQTPGADVAINKYLAVAKKHGLDPTQMALQFVTTRSFVTSNIIGATTMEQLKINIDSINVTLSDEVLKEIDDIHQLHANPCP